MAKSAVQRGRISKKVYEAQLPELREQLVQLQVQLKGAPFKLVLIVAGVAGAGRGDVLNALGEWLDPRGVETFSFHTPTDEERDRPLMWRYWRSLPANGRIGVFAGSWYTETLREQAKGKKELAQLDHELRRIRHFEKLLTDNGALVLKVWLHLSKENQRDRLRALESDPDKAWRVTDDDWDAHRQYDELAETARHIVRETDRPNAAWTVIDAADERARNLAVGQLIVRRLQSHFKRMQRRLATRPKLPLMPRSLAPSGLRRLRNTPLDQKLSEDDYERKREKWLGRLHRSIRSAQAARRSVVFVFEGWDAAGKGGAIRRLTSAIDVRFYRVVPIAKPTEEEISHHYLWRFWRHIPRDGYMTIFDRSWYGRVLVERLEGFARNDEWRRAYDEINDFEEQLTEHGTIVIKFWMHVSKEEQLRRFRAREGTAYKNHKINAEDWRNRRKWGAYEVAIGDMLALTNTSFAAWHVIPANNKRFARLQILKTACNAIEEALEK
ncbi:MAG: polyphosphate:AMP phosphotransferase [Opitutaceae bacterium]|nr:polyphosphate:AMP phosphotransferase [Opitutaceae bacterium]